ncbi:MAG: GFA family protein [Novosphingobium sp.]
MSETARATLLEGQCLCGAVTLRATPAEPHLDACHCTMCRNWGGGPFIALPAGRELEIGGAEHVTRYASSEWAERGFCNRCGTHLFYFYKPAGSYACLAGFFPGADGFALTSEIFVDQQPPYYHFTEATTRKTGAEVIAEMTQGE